jgi:Leucine-rich repeat (LRR) protein
MKHHMLLLLLLILTSQHFIPSSSLLEKCDPYDKVYLLDIKNELGLSNLSQMKSLVSITLYNNKLTGTLPNTLPSLPNLRGIAFDDNQLTGPIPDSYGSFSSSFKVLSLSRNRLSGKIPASLAKLNLTVVDLSWNKLEGDPSVFFGSKKRTEYILLERNLFTFDIEKVDLPKSLKWLSM